MNNKFIAFIIITILLLLTLALERTDHTLLILMYVGFIIVGLYDLGSSDDNLK